MRNMPTAKTFGQLFAIIEKLNEEIEHLKETKIDKYNANQK